MSPVDDELADIWFWLEARERRALCAMCNADADELVRLSWKELPTADRMALIRAMRELGELAGVCAHGLERARLELEREASSPAARAAAHETFNAR